MEAGIGEHSHSLPAAESHVEDLQVLGNVSSGELFPVSNSGHSEADKQQHAGPHHHRRSGPDEDLHDGEIGSSFTKSWQHVSKKKTPVKRWRIVSSSDEEADTLKDRFWRNLEAGILPTDLAAGDLYSSVCMQILTA